MLKSIVWPLINKQLAYSVFKSICKDAPTRDWSEDLQIFSLTLSQLSYRGINIWVNHNLGVWTLCTGCYTRGLTPRVSKRIIAKRTKGCPQRRDGKLTLEIRNINAIPTCGFDQLNFFVNRLSELFLQERSMHARRSTCPSTRSVARMISGLVISVQPEVSPVVSRCSGDSTSQI